MPKKDTPTKYVDEEPVMSGNRFFEYFKSGESYTSLILGIIVVIISSALLLSFFHNRNAVPSNPQPSTQEIHSIAQISQNILPLTGTPEATGSIDEEAAATGPAVTKVPTTTPTSKQNAQSGDAYIVKAGDSLWTIAERQYKSGYNWVDIARVNKLNNPGKIEVGQKLQLPKATTKLNTITDVKKESNQKEQKNTTIEAGKISESSYVVKKGDSLWTIAIRAYGNGYKWTEITKANKLANPDLIHPGNKLNLPRGK